MLAFGVMSSFFSRRIGVRRSLVVAWLLLASAWSVTNGAQPIEDGQLLPDGRTESSPEEDSAVLRLGAPDLEEIRRRDELRARLGRVLHFAAPRPLDVDPWRHGTWLVDEEDGVPTWRLRLVSDGATSLSLVFDRFRLPPGASLTLGVGGEYLPPLTSADADGEPLFTPPVLGSRIDLVLRLRAGHPEDLESLDLHLSRLHHGYAGFGNGSSSPCRVDVACLAGESGFSGGPPAAEDGPARSVGLVLVEGVRYCTGFLVNNSAEDGRPLLITAEHCGITERNASSVVLLWNYRRSSCAGPSATRLPTDQFQVGAEIRAVHRETDLALLELDAEPDPAWGLVWAGWDRSDDPPRSAMVIHHPEAGAQSVAETVQTVAPSGHLGMETDPTGDHLRVRAWDLGTTEGGSSGSPLFDGSGRVVGWLRGGHAACGNRLPDWFGRLSAAWDDERGPGRRLRDWLDPLGAQPVVLDAYRP